MKGLHTNNGGKMNSIAFFEKKTGQYLSVLTCLIAVFLFSFGASAVVHAGGMPHRCFSSSEEAVKSLVAAIRAHDIEELLAVLGPGSRELILSGDDVADRAGREKFITAYDQFNNLKQVSPDKATLSIGPDNWPLPIPIVKSGAFWVFDAEQGKQEILNRRIGRNELHVMDVLHAYVDAQHEYASKDWGGSGVVEFAQRLISTEGKRDGLYWPVKEGEEESPLGPFIAQAAKEGYADADISPFHGYYFMILNGQGKHANGGAYHYVVDGKMILGFGLVAYPAEYGNSGVMTFIVNQQRIIYQKNLGKNTKRLAEGMKIYDPDMTWKKVEDPVKQQTISDKK